MFGILFEALDLLEYGYHNGGIRFGLNQEQDYQRYLATLLFLCNADPVMMRRVPDYVVKQEGLFARYELTDEGKLQVEAMIEYEREKPSTPEGGANDE